MKRLQNMPSVGSGNELFVPKCLVNWCEISNLHKFNLEFQKYRKAERDTILRIKNIDLQHFGQWVLFTAIFARKNGLSENMGFDF